jgi:FdhD protein
MFKRSVDITRIKKDEVLKTEDIVLIEKDIDIIVNSESLVNIICLPKDLKELAVGFLFSIGVINGIQDIKEINADELDNKVSVILNNKIDFNIKNLEIDPVSRVVDTTCGISSSWRKAINKALKDVKEEIAQKKSVKITTELIRTSIVKMQKETLLFKETGGCHGAAIFDIEGNLISVKEDIGRHNAIDKVIGDLIINKKSFNDVFLTSTGRLTGDSVLKAIRAKIPILVSLSAAIESGIRLAFAYGITLIGFARGARMNVYSHPERIIT